jgi:hypothetical protein
MLEVAVVDCLYCRTSIGNEDTECSLYAYLVKDRSHHSDFSCISQRLAILSLDNKTKTKRSETPDSRSLFKRDSQTL